MTKKQFSLADDPMALGRAVFSPDRQYRYELWRIWDASLVKGYAMFIGLNPSTADEYKNDPTVRRCVRFAKDWGYGALLMTNIFAFRATDPEVMKAQENPVGVDNNDTLLRGAAGAGIVIAAWGTHGGHQYRDAYVMMRLLKGKMFCLGKTKHLFPKHPLYVRADTKPEFFF